MKEDYILAFRLLRQAHAHLKYAPSHLSFWGKRIIAFQQGSYRRKVAMARAADSLGIIIEGGLRPAPPASYRSTLKLKESARAILNQ